MQLLPADSSLVQVHTSRYPFPSYALPRDLYPCDTFAVPSSVDFKYSGLVPILLRAQSVNKLIILRKLCRTLISQLFDSRKPRMKIVNFRLKIQDRLFEIFTLTRQKMDSRKALVRFECCKCITTSMVGRSSSFGY